MKYAPYPNQQLLKQQEQGIIRVSKLFAIKYLEKETKKSKNMDMMEDRMRVVREKDMATDLLAVAGIEEPKIFKMRTAMILKSYMTICTIMNVMTAVAVNGRLRAFYLVKAIFMLFGLYSLSNQKSSKMNLIFTGLYGASVLVESIPCVAGILVLFSSDICSVLAGISGERTLENEDFLRFCRKNIESVRLMGSAVIVSEVLLDSFVFFHLVRYQKYMRAVQEEHSNLNYYTGKERIAIP